MTDRAAPRQWPDNVKRLCGEHPAFVGDPLPRGPDGRLTEAARELVAAARDCADAFAEPPPPLEGEDVCVCGELEGLHRIDGTCEASGCSWFVPADEHEEQSPEIRCEYDAGQEPR